MTYFQVVLDIAVAWMFVSISGFMLYSGLRVAIAHARESTDRVPPLSVLALIYILLALVAWLAWQHTILFDVAWYCLTQ